ncbi:Kelch repeat-containing F-box-like protein [Rhynchospora pubera]|uniref:Kelch repeat-containing F-box-like protein n=1 Tax=Rhynchospora pubera TaxID=906938 RepID=A0AAV8G2N2_9POAL|nr:Kelch repeat-containing F-box-like protein [Rhynchospora pubera]
MGVQSTESVEEFNQSRLFNLSGDVLEVMITKVPTVDLIPASRVSREWYLAVHSSLRHHPRRLPWLLLYNYLPPNILRYSVHAFDPASRTWLSIPLRRSSCAPLNHVPARLLSGSSGDRLHALSNSNMAISEDPFGARWHMNLEPPKVWRQDAVLAVVGRWVVITGGCLIPLYGEEELRSVEVYDKSTSTWQMAESMPVQFDGSTSATSLSVAASDENLYVMERKTGVVSWFDPKHRNWGPTCQLKSCNDVSSWSVAVGCAEKLLVVGVGAMQELKLSVRIWEVDREHLQVEDGKSEEMPTEMVNQLFPDNVEDDATWHGWSVEVCGTEYGGYVYNPSAMRNGAVFYELEDDDEGNIVRRWEWVPLPETVGDNLMGRIEVGCSKVGLSDLSGLSL